MIQANYYQYQSQLNWRGSTFFLIMLLTLIIFTSSIAQKKDSKFAISIGAEVSAPMLAYKKMNPRTLIYQTSNGNEKYGGFRKKSYGAAKAGVGLRVALTYIISKVSLQLEGHHDTHSVNTGPYEDFLRSREPFEYKFKHDNYSMNALVFSPNVRVIATKSFMSTVSLSGGLATLKFPDYSLLLPLSQGLTLTTTNVGPTPSLHSFIYGFGIKSVYQLPNSLFAGVNIQFLSSNFHYRMQLETKPGGSGSLTFGDEVNYRVLTTGLSIEYRF